ncbi:hypothetical protein E2C01_077728 [Portunus trituberculatus]|uniref:Uncharacterized protein n=1 Tax=Portunus trituberculatus TaxID=210409 RepID=A0A5B7IQH5_PORTR|nr:hypothetical protein [Portunus trituberculatus]
MKGRREGLGGGSGGDGGGSLAAAVSSVCVEVSCRVGVRAARLSLPSLHTFRNSPYKFNRSGLDTVTSAAPAV